MNNRIYPCLWFEGDGVEAAAFYTEAFADCAVLEQNPMVIMLSFSGQKLMLLNAGPGFKKNSSISFFVLYESVEEVESTWKKLQQGGTVLMPLDEYPWSKKYGWIQDKYGVSWQISHGKMEEVGQRITPTLMFNGANNGRAAEAIDFYCSLFQNSGITGVLKYPKGEDIEGNIKHAQFHLSSYVMMAMDSSMLDHFTFNEGVSLVVLCDTQEEIDHLWDSLTKEGQESQCGWLKDKFNVSWQIVPSILENLMKDPTTSGAVVNAFLKMRKFEIDKLVKAAN